MSYALEDQRKGELGFLREIQAFLYQNVQWEKKQPENLFFRYLFVPLHP